MLIDIDKLTESELVDLNRRIVERLRLMQQMRAHKAMMNFSVGERVQFCSTAGETIRGVIIRYNRKTVTIITDDHRQWNVGPSLIEKEIPPAEVVKSQEFIEVKR